jgi:hypothetical protein
MLERIKIRCLILKNIFQNVLEFWGITVRPGLAELLYLHWRIQPTAIIFYDAKTMNVLFANTHFRERTGYSLKELRTVSYKEMVYPVLDNFEDTEKTLAAYKKKASKEEPWTNVKRYTNYWAHGISGNQIEMNWLTVSYHGVLLNELRIVDVTENDREKNKNQNNV